MKIYLKLLLILVIFITLAAGVGIWYLAQLDFNRYIPKIQEFLKDKWGQDVVIKEIKLSLKDGLSLEGKNITWESEDPFLVSGKLDEFSLKLKPLPLILGRVEFSKVFFLNPTIQIIKKNAEDASQGALPSGAVKEAAGAKPEAHPAKLLESNPLTLVPAFFVQHAKLKTAQIENGKIDWLDERGKEVKRIVIDAINLKAKHISAIRPFDIKGSFHINARPVDLKGRIGPLGVLSTGTVIRFYDLNNLFFKLELSAENLIYPLFQDLFPVLRKETLPLKIAGSEALNIKAEGNLSNFKIYFFQSSTQQKIEFANFLEKQTGDPLTLIFSGQYHSPDYLVMDRALLELDALRLKAKGSFLLAENVSSDANVRIDQYSLKTLKNLIPALNDWNVNGDLSFKLYSKAFNFLNQTGSFKGGLNVKELSIFPDRFAQPIKTDRINIEIKKNKISLEKLILMWGSGQILLGAELSNYWQTPVLQAKTKIKKINLGEVLKDPAEDDLSLAGIVSGSLEVYGERQKGKAFSEVLNGNFSLDAEDGAIRNLNIVDEISRQTFDIPGIGAALRKALEKRFPRIAASPNTDFKKAILNGIIIDGIVNIAEFLITSPEYEVHGKGFYHLRRQHLDFNGRLVFSPEATDALTHMVKELHYLKDEEGKLAFSFNVTAKGYKTKISLFKEFVQELLSKALLSKGIEIIFGKREEVKSEGKGDKPKEEEKKEESQDAQDLIEYGLTKLFKLNKKSK